VLKNDFYLYWCLAFIFFYVFDFNKIKLLNKNINICFVAGIVLLAASTVGILLVKREHMGL
jgi:hypothetical protein